MVQRGGKWQGREFEAALDHGRGSVRDRGPTRAADLEPARGDKPKGAGWWDWSPEQAALAYLLSLIHLFAPTRPSLLSYCVFCLIT